MNMQWFAITKFKKIPKDVSSKFHVNADSNESVEDNQ